MPTYVIYSSETDGQAWGQDAVYETARNTAYSSGTADLFVSNGQTYFVTPLYYAMQALFAFDTNAIPVEEGPLTVTLALYGYQDNSTTDFVQEARLYDFGNPITNDDFVSGDVLANYPLAASLSTAGFTTSGYNNFFSLPAMFSGINNDGETKFVISSDRHRTATAPTGAEYVRYKTAEQAGTTNDPKLTITTMLPLKNSFEGGPDETTITTFNSGPGDDEFDGTSGAAKFDTAQAAYGSYSARFNIAANGTGHLRWELQGLSLFMFRGYFYLTEYPGTVTNPPALLSARSQDATEHRYIGVNSDGTFSLVEYVSGTYTILETSTTQLPLNQWFVLELVGDWPDIEARFYEEFNQLNPDETLSGTFNDGATFYAGNALAPWSNDTTIYWIDNLYLAASPIFFVGADAGPNQVVDEADVVTLDASGSATEVSGYVWEQVSGPAVTLSSTTAEQPTFTAPYVDS